MAEFWLDVLGEVVALLIVTSCFAVFVLLVARRIYPFVQAMKGAMGVSGPITKFGGDPNTEHVQEFRPKEQQSHA